MPVIDWLLDRQEASTGRTKKIAFGSWIFTFLRVLARFKFLRGTPFDPFGRGRAPAPRAPARARLRSAASRSSATASRATTSTSRWRSRGLPEHVRGFESVKERRARGRRGEAGGAAGRLPPEERSRRVTAPGLPEREPARRRRIRRGPAARVVVEGERIASAGDAPVAAAPGDRVVDLRGRTLMPGMVLSHYHSTYKDITIMPEPLGLEKPPGYLMLVAAQNVQTRAARGLHEHHLGGRRERQHRRRAQARDRGRRSSRARACCAGGVGLDTTGDYNDTGKYWWRLGNLGSQRFCDGPDEFRKAVRQEIKRGVEIIKIFASGGHGVADESSTRGFARDELRAILDAAHDRGRARARALRLARPDPRVRARGRRHHRPRRRRWTTPASRRWSSTAPSCVPRSTS